MTEDTKNTTVVCYSVSNGGSLKLTEIGHTYHANACMSDACSDVAKKLSAALSEVMPEKDSSVTACHFAPPYKTKDSDGSEVIAIDRSYAVPALMSAPAGFVERVLGSMLLVPSLKTYMASPEIKRMRKILVTTDSLPTGGSHRDGVMPCSDSRATSDDNTPSRSTPSHKLPKSKYNP